MAEATMTPVEEQQQFYAEIGRAVTQWAAVEDGLFLVFYEAIGAPNQRTSTEQEAHRPSTWIKRKRLHAIVSYRLRH